VFSFAAFVFDLVDLHPGLIPGLQLAMACSKCASLISGPAFLQPVQSTRPRLASSLGQPHVQGDMSSVAAAASATVSATASTVLAVAGAVSLGAASGRKRAKLPKVVRLQQAQYMPSSTLEINYYELDAVEAPRILSAVRLAIKMASPIVQESTSPEERMLKLLSEPSVLSMLTAVSRLPVFSKEMGIAFKEPFLFNLRHDHLGAAAFSDVSSC
jgi:hypothetical protein